MNFAGCIGAPEFVRIRAAFDAVTLAYKSLPRLEDESRSMLPSALRTTAVQETWETHKTWVVYIEIYLLIVHSWEFILLSLLVLFTGECASSHVCYSYILSLSCRSTLSPLL